MKKLLATLLTASLIFQPCIGFAAPVPVSLKETIIQDIQADGALEIEVRSSLFFPYKGNVSVEISNGSYKQTEELDFSSNDTKNSSNTAYFSVPAGTYTVTILADKFAKYEQTIKVEANWIHKLLVCSSKITNETNPEASPGWLQIGDVNKDRMINEDDTKALLSDIRNHPENPVSDSDLNNDGKADIADLQHLVQSMDTEKQTSLVEQLRLSKNIETGDATIVTNGGTATDLLKGQGITVTREDHADISKETPLTLSFALADNTATETELPQIGGIRLLAPAAEINDDGKTDSEITAGTVSIVSSENGHEVITDIPLAQSKARKVKAAKKSARTAATVTTEDDGSLILNFNGQVAIKRVTIKITGTKKTEKLVNIAKVEFVNDMEKRIPAPELNQPVLTAPKSGDKQLTVSWTAQTNVTGYEVFIEGPVKGSADKISQIISAANNTYTISAINDKNLVNFEEYTIKVRSVNGDWRSPWSEEKIGIPKPTAKPEPPDNVKATGGYHSLLVTWKDMEDADGYMVYYKKLEESKDQYQPVIEGFTPVADGTGKIDQNSYTISGLENDIDYSVYVVGWNELGWGSPSLESIGTPKDSVPPVLPNYKLLNTSNGEGKLSAHIASAAIGGSGGAKMEASPLDTTALSGLGLVDNDYTSYWSKVGDWDDGVAYPTMDKGVFVTLDADYQMNYLTFAAVDEAASLETVRIEYWNSETGSANNDRKVIGSRLFRKKDKNNNQFYIVKFDTTITANKIHMCLGRGYTRAEMKIGEIHFHTYDPLEDDIMGLYVDDMHTTLREDVTLETIEALEQRLEFVDEASQELHPLYSELKLELATAKDILNDKPSPSYEVDNRITARKDGHLGFGGLNPWQPLGKVAYSGETLIVYVGHNTKRTGDSADLQLVMTQYHAESNSLARTASLKVGRNEITVPQIADKNYERGGQIYIAYTGNNVNDHYAVRVLGGSDIPTLSVYGLTGTERTNAVKAYIEELEAYVTTIEETHNKIHKGGAKAVDYDYDAQNCILNATDIMMDQMMYSLPAQQAWAGIQNASDKVTTLDKALYGMEHTMQLFYQHKGLSNEDAAKENGNNALPSQHLNIRYMRMFAGAFMYASGNHIGIEWGSTKITGTTNFGWGIAHEIGHDINQGSYAVAEVTNNYFAQLLTGTQRYQYTNVYKKVTSGTVGRASNVFTQLALYWQLHLAFDNNKNDQYVYSTYQDQFNNLFFARVDTYARNPAKAPQSGLTLNGGADQNLMRLSCAAANKNILPFFERWGMVPDADTIAYAAKYGEPETKALYYINPDARDYRVDHMANGTVTETNTIAGKDVVTAVAAANSNQVQISINTNQDKNLILGYEIIRSMTSNGQIESKVVGFQPVDTSGSPTVFTDTVSTVNNRVMTYEVKAVDKFLNYSNAAPAGSVKIQTDGALDKTSWTVETTMTSADDTAVETTDDDPDNGYHDSTETITPKTEHTIDRVIDNDKTSAAGTYNGTSEGTAEIIIDMHETKEITALKYTGTALASVTVEVSENADTWIPVKTEYTGIKGTGEQMIWFDSVEEQERQSWIGTYDARYVKMTLSQAGSISINEIDLCGPSGDNMEFLTADTAVTTTMPAIGILTADYQYGSEAEDVMPKGSLVFTGTYKGNPAYNVVMLYDTDGNVIGAKDGTVNAGQTFFADVPEHGNLGETSDGTWVYYVEPGNWDETTLKTIQGVRGELYRVDNALTLEGERIVSDTKIITIPDKLPDITFTNNRISDKK